MTGGDTLASDFHRLYWQDGKTIAEIANLYGKKPAAIYDLFAKLGVPRRSASAAAKIKTGAVLPAEKCEMVTLYESGKSSNDIGQIMGRDGRLVRSHLKGAGVLRGRADAVRLAVTHGKIRKHQMNEEFFDVLTPESTWVLGLLYGDGHVVNNSKTGQYQVYLAGSKEVCAKVHALLGLHKEARQMKESRPVANRGQLLNCWILQWSSRVLVEKLGEHGLIGGSKATTMTFPALPEWALPHFVRGLWDSDGHWRAVGGYVGATYACSSMVFVDSLINILKNQGWAPRFSEHKTELNGKKFTGYRISLLADHSRDLASWLYGDLTSMNKTYCERKRNIALHLNGAQ